jgi:ribonucleotide reductase beta subunit family protein with ferritin-like domain
MANFFDKTVVFTNDFPEIEKFTKDQLKVFWTADEIHVEKDVQDVLVNLTDAERHGVFTVLKLFTLYEQEAGAEYWNGRFKDTFQHHQLQTMAATFGMFELAVHKPFYNKINELLNAANPAFYTDYQTNPVLVNRMNAIDEYINNPYDALSLAAFSMVEGVILYSSFAFLKHFQSLGKNKLTNIVRGINFSVRDENLHSMAGAYVYRHIRELDDVSPIYEIAQQIYEHENQIIDMIFEKGEIEGITATDLKLFVQSRIAICLQNLWIDPKHWAVADGEFNPIANWFYTGINNFQYNDFFSGQGREYTRDWKEQEFIWVK